MNFWNLIAIVISFLKSIFAIKGAVIQKNTQYIITKTNKNIQPYHKAILESWVFFDMRGSTIKDIAVAKKIDPFPNKLALENKADSLGNKERTNTESE